MLLLWFASTGLRTAFMTCTLADLAHRSSTMSISQRWRRVDTARPQALSRHHRRWLERVFGVDLAGVRVHCGAVADDRAHTAAWGSRKGATCISPAKSGMDPTHQAWILAHEVAHVVQQTSIWPRESAPPRRSSWRHVWPPPPRSVERGFISNAPTADAPQQRGEKRAITTPCTSRCLRRARRRL